MGLDYVKFNNIEFEVIGGYISPVSSAYVKPGLESKEHRSVRILGYSICPAPLPHVCSNLEQDNMLNSSSSSNLLTDITCRLKMCELAIEHDTDWVMLDPWEAIQDGYTPTTEVLDHFQSCLNVETISGSQKPITVVLLAGADLIQTMSSPDIWTAQELEHIFKGYLAFVVERSGTDVEDALASLKSWRERIHVIPQLINNDVSSTKVRLSLKRRMSVRYLVPARVIAYIEEHGLYRE